MRSPPIPVGPASGPPGAAPGKPSGPPSGPPPGPTSGKAPRTAPGIVCGVVPGAASGFSLPELLVVIGIIAILIALLMPALRNAQRSSMRIKCAANLRVLAQAMHLYASANRDHIPGGPNTTGLHLFPAAGGYSEDNCPEISQIWDYQAPLAKVMGIGFNPGPTRKDRVERFTNLLKHKAFSCPENDILATAFTGGGGPDFPVTPWISYASAAVFHYYGVTAPSWYTYGWGKALPQYSPPPGYAIKLQKIGDLSRKIFLADGGRFLAPTGPTMDLDYKGKYGGAFADVGPWSRFSRAWPRGGAPGNGGSGPDLRYFSYRHGLKHPNGPADSYRLNVAFYDGHVETMGDLQAANPVFWAPRGTLLEPTEAYPDVYERYFKGKPSPYLVP